MKIGLRSLAAAVLSLALLACQPNSADVAAEPVVVKTAMNDVVTQESETVLNILIEALDESAKVDPSKLTDDDWTAIEAAATRLRDTAMALRDGDVQVVAAPGETIDGEDNPGALGAADVQARIDANPDDFKTHAGVLLAETERMVTASQTRDTATLWDVGLNLDQTCTECHEQFWYPEPPS